MKTVNTIKLTQEGAMTILRGALDKARSLGVPASVAVVDDGGHLIAFGRSEEAELYSVAISQAKARSAALTRFPSGKKSPSGNERDDHHAIAITLAAGPGSCHHSRRLSDHGERPLCRRGWSQRRRQK